MVRQTPGRGFIPFAAVFSPALALAVLVAVAWLPPSLAGAEDSCIACHRDQKFQVTNKKLFDYYRLWRQSVHADEGVGCADCHGGDEDEPTKRAAHGTPGLSAALRSSPVNYRNIPRTCAQCHEAYYEHFRRSPHFKHLQNGEDERQGPSCVTCHASVNTTVLNVNTVKRTCAFCHNEETGNHPEIPGRAEFLLSKFLSIHRYYRYLTIKGGILNEQETFEQIEERTAGLFIEWHTFDLAAIERETAALLKLLKRKRNEIRERLHRP